MGLSFYFFGAIDNEIARKLTSKEIDSEKEMTRNRESPSKKSRVSCDAAKAKYAHHKTHKIKRTETGYETLNIYIPSPVAFPARAVPAHERYPNFRGRAQNAQWAHYTVSPTLRTHSHTRTPSPYYLNSLNYYLTPTLPSTFPVANY